MPPRPRDCWTTQPPEEAGWYWWRQDMGQRAVIGYVPETLGVMCVPSYIRPVVRCDEGVQWFGPLEEPGGDADAGLCRAYAQLASEVQDIAARIGPARLPESIRAELLALANRLAVWATPRVRSAVSN